jgi:carbamoyltransferase
MTVRIVGFNLSHDSSACLVEDGVIRSALALERTTRVKHGTVPLHSYSAAMADLVSQLLADAGMTAADVDYWIATSTEARDDNDEAQLARVIGLVAPPEKTLHLPHPSHHLAHASAAFYSSGYEEAASLIIDAYGSLYGPGRERETAFHFRTGEKPKRVLEVVRESDRIAGTPRDGQVWLPDSLSGIGELYRVITLALGFRESGTVYDDAGKTMGLASYGKPLTSDNLFIQPVADGALDFSRAVDSLLELGLAVRDEDRLRLVSRPSRQPFEQFHHDLAAQIQAEFEEAVLHQTREVLARTGSRSLVVAGGCFLNSIVNTRIKQETEVDRLFIFPAATDDGNAAGAALYAYHNLAGQPPMVTPRIKHVYFGPSRLAGRDIKALAGQWQLSVRQHEDVAQVAASAIGRGEIVGWFQDRAEFGPRALGARSILCHPGIEGMKDRLNARVKFREAFRPFAGSVLAEKATAWFEMPAEESPFMLHVCPVLPHGQDTIREVVHIDGTCRVQTVGKDNPGLFRELIEAFEEQTGLPMVLNTSFNLRGMPVVERPEDALDCLYGSRLDRLFIGDLEIEAPDMTALRPVLTEPGTRQTAVAALSATGPAHSSALDGLDQVSLRILELADGLRPMRDIAGELDVDVDKAIDLVLDMKRLGLLRWADLPRSESPVYPLPQYSPNK